MKSRKEAGSLRLLVSLLYTPSDYEGSGARPCSRLTVFIVSFIPCFIVH
jgi:hypothetical protein